MNETASLYAIDRLKAAIAVELASSSSPWTSVELACRWAELDDMERMLNVDLEDSST
jgi:hypothetical protein